MNQVIVTCPKCGGTIQFKNWFHWVWKCPFHWFGKRRVKCPHCGETGWAAPKKPVIWHIVFETSKYTVAYDKRNKVYRVCWFEDGHFVDECRFAARD